MTATWLEDKTYGPMEFKCLVALRAKLRKQINFKKNLPVVLPNFEVSV